MALRLIGNKRAIHSESFHRKKKLERNLKISLIILALLAIFIVPILILRNHHLQVSKITISGNEVVSSESLTNLINADLSGDYLKIIPKTNFLFYPKREIIADILKNFSEIKAASASLEGASTLSVNIAEEKPEALYCEDSCYFLDKTGFIFGKAPEFNGEVYMIYKTDPVITNPIGKYAFGPVEFAKLEEFVAGLRQLDFNPVSLLASGESYTLKLESGPNIIWRAGQDPTVLIGNLESLLNGIPHGKVMTFSYVDLSYENKIYYK